MNTKSLANLRPSKPGESRRAKSIERYQSLSDNYRTSLLETFKGSGGMERLSDIIKNGTNKEVIEISRIIASIIPRNITFDKTSQSTQLVVTASVPTPTPTQDSQPIDAEYTTPTSQPTSQQADNQDVQG